MQIAIPLLVPPQIIDILRAFTGNAISITVIRYTYIVFLFLSCWFRFNEIKGIRYTYTLSEKDNFNPSYPS